jgi:short subunit dehydrogenase-like uncharacterized protein
VNDWILYGAYGYTGRLIAEEAVRRGMRPTLAGRDAPRATAIAKKLDCPVRAFDLNDPGRIASQLAGHRAVLHCAGPFSATARPMVEACLAAGVHYLDITGEIEVIEAAAALGERAAAAGVVLLPAVGFDVVPSDCLAAMLAQKLPGATLLQLAFAGTGSISPGTAKTMLEAFPRGGRVRIDGRITPVPAGWKTMDVPFDDGPQPAVTVPWGDVATAWHSTGIGNIEVYLAMTPRQIRWFRRLHRFLAAARFALPLGLLQWGIRRFIAGPSAEERRTLRGSFWGRVSDATGQTVEATLVTASGYQLTVWAALACLERVLAGTVAGGFWTPSKAFGPDFVLSIPETELRWR